MDRQPSATFGDRYRSTIPNSLLIWSVIGHALPAVVWQAFRQQVIQGQPLDVERST